MPKFRPLSETKFINDANLVSYWKLDGNSNDSKGSATSSDSNVSYIDGKFGQCIDGTGVNVSGALISNMPLVSGNHTLALWFKADAKAGSLLSARTDIQEFRSAIQINSTDILPLAGTGSTWLNTDGIACTYSTGVWYHLVVVYTSTGVTVYLNGSSIGSKTWSSNTPVFTPANGKFGMLYAPRYTDEGFNGSLDDVAVFSKALTASEVNELYQDKGMTLGEYLGAGSGTTKLLLHLNGNSTDSSGNGNNGTDTAITYSQANGKFGQGAGFNGSVSKIVITDNASLKPSNLTLSCWFNLSSNINGSGQVASIISREHYNQGYVLNLLSPTYGGYTNNLEFYCANGTNGYAADLNSNIITTGIWYNAIGTFDSSYVRLYLNGKLVATSSAFSGSISYATTSNFTIGVSPIDSARDFPGKIDEVILENRAWTAEEIKKYYTYSKGRFNL